MTGKLLELRQLCEMDCRPARSPNEQSGEAPFVGLANISKGTGLLDMSEKARSGGSHSQGYTFDKGHVLYGKLRPYLNKVAVPEFVGRCSTQIVPLKVKSLVQREYLAYALRRPEAVRFAMSCVVGSTRPVVDMAKFLSLQIYVPPLKRQKWITETMKLCERVGRGFLARSEFLEELKTVVYGKMFGAGCDERDEWPRVPFLDIVEDVTSRITHIPSRDYMGEGNVAVVDQGSGDVAGFAEEGGRLLKRELLPAVVFGDHTRRVKLIRIPFYLGGQGTKAFSSQASVLDPVHLYMQLRNMKLPSKGYARHYGLVKELKLIVPPMDKQQAYRVIYDRADELREGNSELIGLAESLLETLFDRLFDWPPQ